MDIKDQCGPLGQMLLVGTNLDIEDQCGQLGSLSTVRTHVDVKNQCERLGPIWEQKIYIQHECANIITMSVSVLLHRLCYASYQPLVGRFSRSSH